MTEVFPDLTTVLKIDMTLPNTSCEAEKPLSKLSVIKKQILLNHAREKTEMSFYSHYRKGYYNIVVI